MKKTMNNIQLIDLGLPSGTLWADRNLGADAPEQTGDYYRFGETVAFTEDSPEYVCNEIEGDIAGTDRDAATVNLGKNYRMPTLDQVKELIYECKWKWTKQNEIKGMKVTGPNGNSIFLPASGSPANFNSSFGYVGSYGYCWSASPYNSCYGYYLGIGSRYRNWYNGNRANAFPIRAVAGEFTIKH